jgi:hypothetical protein
VVAGAADAGVAVNDGCSNRLERICEAVLALFPRSRREFQKERREHQDQCAHYQRPGQDKHPSCALRRRPIDLRIHAVSQNQAETVGMIIKDHNALYCFALSICCRPPARLLDDENPPRTAAGLLAHRRKAMMVHGPNEGCCEWHCSMARTFPFHSSRYARPAQCRYDASVGFFDLTREALSNTSSGRAPFASRLLSRQRAEVAPGSAGELKLP